MKVLGRLCSCSWCIKSSYNNKKDGFWHPCGCPVSLQDTYWIGDVRHGLGADKHPIQGVVVDDVIYDIKQVVTTGGRCALWVYLEENEQYTILPAKRVGQKIEGEVIRFMATVHGCHKVSLNQQLVIWRSSK
jgi:hypothetical protein